MDDVPTGITLYADGLCEPNPGGWACWGWVALGPGAEVLGQGQGCLGAGVNSTNNIAEYEAVLQALLWAFQAGYRVATVRSDSQLVIRQITGAYACNLPALQALLGRVRKAQGCMTLTFEWVPREQNTAADALSRAAYRAATGHEPPERHKPAARPAPPAIPPNPAGLPVRQCESCHAPILWGRHQLTNRPAPLDAVPSAAGTMALLPNGNYEHVPESRRGEYATLYMNHYATCPDRQEWRKKGA